MRKLRIGIRVQQQDLDSTGLVLDAQDYMNTVGQDWDTLQKATLEALWLHHMPYGIDTILQGLDDTQDYQTCVLEINIPENCTTEAPTTAFDAMCMVIDCLYLTDSLEWDFLLPHQQ